MSNLADFSPYKRSYQFMHLQNTAYHLRNKRQVKPVINTNVRRSHSFLKRSVESKECIFFKKQSDRYTPSQGKVKEASTGVSVSFIEPHRVIHKHQNFQRAQSAKIDHQNKKIVKKLIYTECQIVSNRGAQDHYQKHRKFSNMIRKYQENGQRYTTPIIHIQKLNPALAGFKKSRVTSARNRAQAEHNPEELALTWK